MIDNIATIGCSLAVLGPGIGIGPIGMRNQGAAAHQPELERYLHVNMLLSIVFTEALGLLGFVAGFAFGS